MKVSTNSYKWVVTFMAAVLAGILMCFTDAQHDNLDYVRHIVITLIPALTALKTTLDRPGM
jgi:hypothetical protein